MELGYCSWHRKEFEECRCKRTTYYTLVKVIPVADVLELKRKLKDVVFRYFAARYKDGKPVNVNVIGDCIDAKFKLLGKEGGK